MTDGEYHQPSARVVQVAATREELATAVAGRISEILAAAIAERGEARWVLSGGSTPIDVYKQLVADHAETLDWPAVRFFWGDERSVPATSADSNYGSARRWLLEPLGINGRAVQRIRGELGQRAAAEHYSGVVGVALEKGRWDLVVLGLGADGHTASLFSARDVTAGQTALAIATAAPVAPHRRVSLTVEALINTRRLLFVVSGESKARAVRRLFDGDSELPATHVLAGHQSVEWCLDRQAMTLL